MELETDQVCKTMSGKTRMEELEGNESVGQAYYNFSIKHSRAIGNKAFHTIVKLLTEGLPPTDDSLQRVFWDSDRMVRDLSDEEEKISVALALEIELMVRNIFVEMMLDDRFIADMKNAVMTKHAKQMARVRVSKSGTNPSLEKIKNIVLENEDMNWKELLREFEKQGLVKENESSESLEYLVVHPDRPESEWESVGLLSWPSKISRLKR